MTDFEMDLGICADFAKTLFPILVSARTDFAGMAGEREGEPLQFFRIEVGIDIRAELFHNCAIMRLTLSQAMN